MEKTQIQRLKPKARTAPHQKTLILNAWHKSSSDRNRKPHRRSRRKPSHIAEEIQRKERQNGGVFTSEEADEKEAVERKIRALQSIVPGGESLGVDKLFEQTAEYIINLQHQVKAMRALSSFFERLEKEKSKCGG